MCSNCTIPLQTCTGNFRILVGTPPDFSEGTRLGGAWETAPPLRLLPLLPVLPPPHRLPKNQTISNLRNLPTSQMNQKLHFLFLFWGVPISMTLSLSVRNSLTQIPFRAKKKKKIKEATFATNKDESRLFLFFSSEEETCPSRLSNIQIGAARKNPVRFQLEIMYWVDYISSAEAL